MDVLPIYIKNKWQEITDLLAKITDTPSALIMYAENEYMEVCISSRTKGNPYQAGNKEKGQGLYCETVIKSQKELLIPNALNDRGWDKNPDIKHGMISYLGFPINFPDKKPFGTICVLDKKENKYSETYIKLIHHFRDVIENDLSNMFKYASREKEINKFSVAVEQSANTIVITDLAGNIEYTNPKFTKITGYTAEEVLGKNTRILNSGEQSKEFYSNMWKIISEGEIWSGEFKNKKKNGKLYWEDVTISAIKNDAGQIINYLAVKNDISTLKKNEKKLKKQNKELIITKAKVEESESKFRELFEKSGDAIVINKNGRIVDFNLATVKLFGYHLKDDFINIHPAQLSPAIQPDGKSSLEKVEEVLNLAAINGTHRFEWMHKKSDGQDFLCEILVTLIKNEPNDSIFHSVIREITSYKKTEQELIIAKEKAEESDQLKTEFINNMSHEIRTPMNGILGFSEMLSNNDISDEKRASFIKIIQSSGQQLLNVIDDILEISRLGTNQVKIIETDVCLNDMLFELFSTFDLKAKEQNTPLFLKKSLSDNQSTVLTDKSKLVKVLSNLLENSLKFTHEGFIDIGYQLKNDEIEFYVKDTGIGIKKSKHESIFDRFSQAEKDLSKKVGGLGLGLSIAKENTELLGGTIQLESVEGKGATFFVTIPYKPVYKVNDIEKAKNEPKYTILIAEDEEINYLYIDTLLKDIFGLNCKIIHVTNGKEAFETCKENKAIELVLMDLKMPIMNGFEAIKLIKSLLPNLPIIAQTAYSTPQEKEQAILVGCDDFMSKPIHQESFKNILDKYLLIK